FATNFPHALSVLGADPDYDAVVQCSDTCDDQPMGSWERILTYARSLTDAAAKSAKPCYFMTTRSGVFHRDLITFLRQHGIPLVGGTRQGLGAIDRLARWSEPTPAPRGGAEQGQAIHTLLRGRARRTIHEYDAKRLLGQTGLPVVAERLVTTPDDARATAKAPGRAAALRARS